MFRILVSLPFHRIPNQCYALRPLALIRAQLIALYAALMDPLWLPISAKHLNERWFLSLALI